MAAKRVLQPFHALVNGDMSGNLVSQITNGMYQDNIGMQVKWTSSDAVGTIAVEASINYDENLGTGDFEVLTFPNPLNQPASNNGGYLINLNQLPYKYFRLTYTRVSGSGTLNAWFCSKGLD